MALIKLTTNTFGFGNQSLDPKKEKGKTIESKSPFPER
jgi:hypothetical protein